MIKISVGVVKKAGESVAIAYCLNFENDTFPSFPLVSEGFSHTRFIWGESNQAALSPDLVGGLSMLVSLLLPLNLQLISINEGEGKKQKRSQKQVKSEVKSKSKAKAKAKSKAKSQSPPTKSARAWRLG